MAESKKNLFAAVFLIGISFLSLTGPVFADLSATCPVMSGEKAKEKFFADYGGKRYHFCCRSCVKKFKKNPQKYIH